jgi:hypothetical protein
MAGTSGVRTRKQSQLNGKTESQEIEIARYLEDIEGPQPRLRRNGSKVSSGGRSKSVSAQPPQQAPPPPVWTPAAVEACAELGEVDWDQESANGDEVRINVPWPIRQTFQRNVLVYVCDGEGKIFLARTSGGPYFQRSGEQPSGTGLVQGRLELLGELQAGQLVSARSRPAPGSKVRLVPGEHAAAFMGLQGGMVLGRVAGAPDSPWLRLDAKNKGVLPRNVGIFGTVGAGKTNTAQVLIEEAAANGWAVVVLDVEGEYVEMDAPCGTEMGSALASFGKEPEGLKSLDVLYPASCSSQRQGACPFTLRLADFEAQVIAELLEVNLGERNALLDLLEYFQQKAKTKLETQEKAGFQALLDPSPQAKVPFNLTALMVRVKERNPQSSPQMDYLGLGNKLTRLQHAEIMDQPTMRALDMPSMVEAGKVTVVDVSLANDLVRNLVTVDLLRKLFMYKVVHEDAPPTLLLLEEAHSFISKERAKTMQATVQMLRDVARRGRKRWLGLGFVSQQPGHLPTEIFELCNTRIVHTVRSLHNLEALMATAGDIDQAHWARCPSLGPGEVLISSPQLPRPVFAAIRPASSKRRFTR